MLSFAFLGTLDKLNLKIVSVKKYIVNPDYDINAGTDTAVVILNNAVANIAPVPIITSSTPSSGERIIIYGYGTTESNTFDGALRAREDFHDSSFFQPQLKVIFQFVLL
jgi:hypothetical protein